VAAKREKSEREKSEELLSPESKKQKILEQVQWVSGQLHVPKACGGRFLYSLKDFGCFDDELSIENALSLYIDTMLFGWKVAVQVRDELVNKELSPALPASGRNLMLDGKRLTPTFCASPIGGANPIPGVIGRAINQGDLFQGKLNFQEVTDAAVKKLVLLSSDVDATEERDVLVKVSSIAVHSLLIHPDKAYIALRNIRASVDRKVIEELCTVLYAVVKTEVGLMTIMADLSRQGYKTLHPASYNLEILWEGFSKLVKDVLLPMAEFAKVIHPDIRPGFNVTCNILVDESLGGNTMKLVDYESLIEFQAWHAPALSYLQCQLHWDAVTFVWWQSVSVAHFWNQKVDADSRAKSDPRKFEMQVMMSMLLTNVEGPDWLMKLRDKAKRKVSKAEVVETLDVLADLFKNSFTMMGSS
jgi:hypothetical protein